MWWTEEKIGYYETAAKETGFHRDIVDAVERFVGKDESILELGAGLGHATELLANDGYRICGTEAEKDAVAVANRRAGFPLLKQADAYSAELEKADAVLLLFFGNLTEEGHLERFLSLARRRIIHLASRHRGYGLSGRKDTCEETRKFLLSRGLEVETIELESDFDQPLRSIEDAHRFFELSYGRNDIRNLYVNFDSRYPYMFRNHKSLVLNVIEKKKGKELRHEI